MHRVEQLLFFLPYAHEFSPQWVNIQDSLFWRNPTSRWPDDLARMAPACRRGCSFVLYLHGARVQYRDMRLLPDSAVRAGLYECYYSFDKYDALFMYKTS